MRGEQYCQDGMIDKRAGRVFCVESAVMLGHHLIYKHTQWSKVLYLQSLVVVDVNGMQDRRWHPSKVGDASVCSIFTITMKPH